MRTRRSVVDWMFDTINVAFLVFWSAITLYPLLFVLFASLSDGGLLASHRGLLLFPLRLNFQSYSIVLRNPVILQGYRNTLIVVICGTSLNLVMTALGGYFLTKKDVMFRKIFLAMIIVTMYFGGGMIPSYLLVTRLGMRNTLLALIIPGAVSTYNMIIMRTSFQSIPDSLVEAAVLDGASEFTILWRVVVPLSTAIFAVMALWYGVDHWNAWFGAAIYLTKRELWPIQLHLRQILIQRDTAAMTIDAYYGEEAKVAETIKYSTIVVATVPILCVYPFLQKYFIKGVMVGSLKG